MADVIEFPTDVFSRWRARVTDARGTDPRDAFPCKSCHQTFAWRGYDGLCGWCFEALVDDVARLCNGEVKPLPTDSFWALAGHSPAGEVPEPA